MANSPALTVRRRFPRAPDRFVKALAEVPTGWIVDANGRRGALDYRIRALTRAVRFCGVALTVDSRARDNLAPYAAIQFAQPGDVMVIATGSYEGSSVVGDILVGMARNQGIAAMVTDGLVRDVDGLNNVGLPIFARGLSPNSPQKDGPGTIGLPIVVAGTCIDSGDVIVGDQDGVVVIAREAVESVVAGLDEIRAKEKKLDALVASGAKLPAGMDALIAEKGMRFVD